MKQIQDYTIRSWVYDLDLNNGERIILSYIYEILRHPQFEDGVIINSKVLAKVADCTSKNATYITRCLEQKNLIRREVVQNGQTRTIKYYLPNERIQSTQD